MNPVHDYQTLSDVVLPETLLEENPDLFNDSQINWLIRNREHNGLKESGAVLKVGRKLYLSRMRFHKWFYNQKG